MAPASTEGGQLLEEAYRDLDLVNGSLIETSIGPRSSAAGISWERVGDWLNLAQRMGAERVFFVGDEPVVVFSRLPQGSGESEVIAAYRKAWSLARPRCLFLATEDELRVYGLSQPPVRGVDDKEKLTPLEVVSRGADVADRLAAFHRERLESGEAFETVAHLGKRDGSADQQLVRDVQEATKALREAGLSHELAHVLVERVILVRYLEDRHVIDRSYFMKVARKKKTWGPLLANPKASAVGVESDFVQCLSNKAFTYEVFSRLARDFNGDLFAEVGSEQRKVTAEHLRLVQSMLTGAGIGAQKRLFLWAYDFGVVPTSLISSMYEHFYRAGTEDDSGTHYTPPELVEYLLSETLTPEVLNLKPRVCDPACGSGIFLVEAFRLMVRHAMAQRGRRLSSAELQKLLLTRIIGIDLNKEAIRLAAFSLYLALLNYQEPRDIRSAGPLPRLIRHPGRRTGDVLYVGDAFDPMTVGTSRANGVEGSFDVVVGNPPWDEPKGAEQEKLIDSWTRERKVPVGNRSPSESFLWLTLSLLKPDGVASVLVAAPSFHNVRSQKFRDEWLRHVRLDEVVNFTSVRNVFFSESIAPFMLVKFGHADREASTHRVLYRMARRSKALGSTGSMTFARLERKWVDQESLRQRDYLWKVYAWGTHHDDALMSRLDAEKNFSDVLPDDPGPGYGYQRGKTKQPSEVLRALPSLTSVFEAWGPLRDQWFEPAPTGVKREPDERLYEGQRILVSRGVKSGFGPSARLETKGFSFRHTVYCIPLAQVPAWQAKVLLGILLSSIGRYRLFMRSGSWGVWHDSIVPDDIKTLPVRLDEDAESTKRIVDAVDALRELPTDTGLLKSDTSLMGSLEDVLTALDSAVFDLFDLTPGERDLVQDFHSYTLPLTGGDGKGRELARLSAISRSGSFDQLAEEESPIAAYLTTFLSRWNAEVGAEANFRWRVVAPHRVPMVAAVFELDSNGVVASDSDDSDWSGLLQRLSRSLGRRITERVVTDGVLRAVSDESIVVIKANEARLWSTTAARDDAEATMLQAMALRR